MVELDLDLAALEAAARAVPDPELPVVTLGELGVVRGVAVAADGAVEVAITPTYVGCPATEAIAGDVRAAVEARLRADGVAVVGGSEGAAGFARDVGFGERRIAGAPDAGHAPDAASPAERRIVAAPDVATSAETRAAAAADADHAPDAASPAEAEGAPAVEVRTRTVLSPAWSTDWISEEGRRKLAAHGIAPPSGRRAVASGPVFVQFCRSRAPRPPAADGTGVRCPHCGSAETRLISAFGSTPCQSLRACRVCGEPFGAIKTL